MRRERLEGPGALLSAVGLAVLVLSPAPADACLAHHHTLLSLVTDSPLIVVGEVEQVDYLPLEKRADNWEPTDRGGRPAIATVRVIRVLKGQWDGAAIKIKSGPIGSCAPYPVHRSFREGQKSIFILPTRPTEGKVRLICGGSVRPLEETDLVEAAVPRGPAWRAEYIEGVRTTAPDILASAEALHARLGEAHKTWPVQRPTGRKVTAISLTLGTRLLDVDELDEMEDPEDMPAQVKKWADDLARSPEAALRTALALDWPQRTWSDHYFWSRLRPELERQMKPDVNVAGRAHFRRILVKAGVTGPQIDAYLATVRDRDVAELGFPFGLPDPWNVDRKGDVLTTDFILRFHSFDRAWMFVSYGMRFEQLATLNPDRLSNIIPVMYGSLDEDIRRVAVQAIHHSPGGAGFAPLILRDLLGGRTDAWRALRKNGADRERFEALVHTVRSDYAIGGQKTFWQALRRGECFHPVCIEAAIDLLADPNRPAETDGLGMNELFLEAVLHEYLTAAMAGRAGRVPPPETVDEYRKFFQASPVFE